MPRSSSINRSDTAYERLKADIVANRWPPDTTLSTYGLAEALGMSRTPIIEALKRLEADGLIEIIPQVGCRVLRRAPEDISQTFMIRAALEGLAAEVAASRIIDDEIAALEAILEQADAACAAGDPVAYEKANGDFHVAIVQVSGVAQLERLLSSLWTLNRYQLASSSFLATRMALSNREHRLILAALKARDPEAAGQAVNRHLRKCGNDYLEFVGEHLRDGQPRLGALAVD